MIFKKLFIVSLALLLPLGEIEGARALFSGKSSINYDVTNNLDGAYEIAKGLTNPAKKVEVFTLLAGKYAANGRVEKALILVDEVGNDRSMSSAKIRLITSIIVNLVKTRQSHSALSVLKNIHDPQEQGLAAENLVYIFLDNNELSDAERALTTVQNRYKKAILTSAIVKAYAEKGNFDRALLLVKQSPIALERDKTMQVIIKNMIDYKLLNRAFETADNIIDLETYNQSMTYLTKAIARNGQLNEALNLAKSMETPEFRDDILATIAVEGAKKGQPEKSLVLLEAVGDKRIVDQAKADISIELARNGWMDNAVVLAGEIETTTANGSAFFGIAKEFAQNEEFDKAMEAMKLIRDPKRRLAGFPLLAREFGRSKKYHYALLLINQFKPDDIKWQSLANFTTIFASHGRPSKVESIIRDIRPDSIRLRTFADVSQIYANEGRWEDALKLAGFIDDAKFQAEELFLILLKSKANGNKDVINKILEMAEKLEFKMNKKEDRAWVLMEIAKQNIYLKNFEKAESMLNNARFHVFQVKNEKEKAKLQTQLAVSYFDSGLPLEAYAYIKSLDSNFQKAVILSELPEYRHLTQESFAKYKKVLKSIIESTDF